MSGGSLFVSTVRFPDVVRGSGTLNVTVQDEEMLIRRLPRPTSSAPCSLPTRLVLPMSSPHAIVRRLDVSGAALFVEHAIPNQSTAWLPLLLPMMGEVPIPARVTQTLQREEGACWIAEVKFQLADRDSRAGVVGLVTALRHAHAKRSRRRTTPEPT